MFALIFSFRTQIRIVFFMFRESMRDHCSYPRGAYQFVDGILGPTKALPRATSALIIVKGDSTVVGPRGAFIRIAFWETLPQEEMCDSSICSHEQNLPI